DTAEVLIATSAEDRAGFPLMYSAIAKHNTVRVTDIHLTEPYFKFTDPAGQNINVATVEPGIEDIPSDAIEKHVPIDLTFRFPPLPPVNGFNVFGSVKSLRLSDARGQLWMRSQLIELPAPADVEISGIEHFEAAGGVMTLPLEAHDHGATLDFKSSATVIVNGDTRSTVAEKYGIKPTIEVFVMFATAAQMVAAFISFLRYRRAK
ncbi:MAG TPA: hypothetical protein VHX14_12015, partial [Thermoanaerobaculia bacterium]|nr:hypothetical protein [Thermoanaerobaculia bacterium]